MGFFQDLKQDLSQTVNELGDEAVSGIGLEAESALDEVSTSSEDLFGSAGGEFADLEAMLEKEVEALGNVPPALEESSAKQDLLSSLGSEIPQEPEIKEEVPVVETVVEAPKMEEINIEEEKDVSEADMEMEELLNEVEQNVEEPVYIDAEPVEAPKADYESNVAVSTDTAVITAGMNITGDITSSGNMDLIGSITGNIEILGKLNVTGNINGNSSAAEIYAEAAQINGEIKSKGSVKIGQSSVVIGNIFATSAVIAGAVKGDIDVHGPVILDTSAIVMGNIKSKSVQINNGAVIEGMCSQCYADVSPTSFFNDVKKNRK